MLPRTLPWTEKSAEQLSSGTTHCLPWDWHIWKYELMLIRCTSGITKENSRGKGTPSHLKSAPDFLGCQASLQQARLIASDASELWVWAEPTALFYLRALFSSSPKATQNWEQMGAVTLWWDDCKFRELGGWAESLVGKLDHWACGTMGISRMCNWGPAAGTFLLGSIVGVTLLNIVINGF